MAFFSPFSLFDVPVTPRRYCIVKRQPSLTAELDSLLSPFLFGESLCQKPKAKPRPKPAKWVECVQLSGFSPREVKAEVKGRKVIIIGKSVEGDNENKNIYQTKRTVVIPADVDASTVTCHYVPRRFVLLEGSRVRKSDESKPAVQPAARIIPVLQPDDQDPTAQQKASDVTKTPDGAADAPKTQESPEKTDGENETAAPEERSEAVIMETSAAQAVPEGKAASEEDRGKPSEESDAASTRAQAGDNTMEVDLEDDDDSGSDDEHMVNILRSGTDDHVTTSPDTAADSAVSKTTTADLNARPAHFEVIINLRGFHPDEVKVSRDGCDVVIDAERVEKRGDCTSRQVFHQTVALPSSVDAAQLRSFLRDDGQLMVTAPYCQAATDVTIPIHVE